jgi:propionate CoA-transferase
MVAYVHKHHYDRMARYATSALTREKLQDALRRRGLETRVHERAEDALAVIEQEPA